MRERRIVAIALVIVIPALALISFQRLKSAKEYEELTERESVGLTNALRVISTKRVLGVGFSEVDNRAFVQTGFITNKNGVAQRDGYVFELGSAGWRLIVRPIGSLNL